MRKPLLICWLAILFSGIGYLFWYNEWRYSLPTPVPQNYQAVQTGTLLGLNNVYSRGDESKPVLLHFFNPDCPCSRFNIKQFRSLFDQYNREVNFVVVVQTDNKDYTAESVRSTFDLTVPVLFDSSIANACGVYSTPQAAIISTDRRLYYRGNYNKSRYCTAKETNYAELALNALLKNSVSPFFGDEAHRSYGCQLPIYSN